MNKRLNIENRKANYLYSIVESFEVGIVLNGLDVKQLLNEKVDITTSYCLITNGEIYVYNINFHSANYKKLLMHKKEILKLFNDSVKNNLSIIPLAIYESNNKFKMKIGLAKPKKMYDKRETLKKRDNFLNMNRFIKK